MAYVQRKYDERANHLAARKEQRASRLKRLHIMAKRRAYIQKDDEELKGLGIHIKHVK